MKKIASIILVLVVGIVSVKSYVLSKDLRGFHSKIEQLQKDIDRTEGNTKKMNEVVYNENAKEFNSIIKTLPDSIINAVFLGYKPIAYK